MNNQIPIVNYNTESNVQHAEPLDISRFNIEWSERWDSMYMFIYYNQFRDYKVTELNDKLRKEKNNNSRLRGVNKRLRNENLTLNENYNVVMAEIINRVRENNDSKEPPPKRRNILLIPKKEYVHLTKDQMQFELQKTFNNLNNLNDIIALEKHPHKYDFITNAKFKLLYNIIPDIKKLNDLVGMNKVKNDVFEHICYFVHGLNNKNEIMHIVITGSPGVGKTELGKIIGRLYFSMGFLSTDKFVFASRSDLIGEYLGHTAAKTQKVINSANGGVLFIDEVYSLGNSEKRDSFAKECIDTINQNLTENKGKFLCIVAGYKEDIDSCFFSYNQGLERRFPIKYQLDGYDAIELYDIFKYKLKDTEMKVNDDLTNFFIQHKAEFKYYGGDIEQLIMRAGFVAGRRMLKETITVNPEKILTISDLEDGLKLILQDRIRKDDIPFGMYM